MFEIIELGGLKTVTSKAPVNHVYVVDVSGSMYHDLPKVRQNMKNIISLVAQPEDTFSVIYFSGRGQCGVVFENLLVSDLTTIDVMHKAIDRYIQPIGLTGFIDPMDKAMELNLTPGKMNNFIMMTDGYENQSNRKDILVKAANLTNKYQSVSFIEYGYYADRKMLAELAEVTGGTHIFAEGFIQYEEVVKQAVSGAPRVNNIEVKVNKAAKHCVFVNNGSIRIVPVNDGVALVPEDTTRVHSIVPKDVLSKQLSAEHLYLILFYASKQNNDELVWNVLQMLGDVALVEAYGNAFTKQELSDFEGLVQDAVLDESKRFLKGKDLNAVPNKNAPTVLHLLGELVKCEGAELVMTAPYWNYKSIGRAAKAENPLPRFVPSPMSSVALNKLVFSSERPNVSVNTTLDGIVELPENNFGLTKVDSFINRNYAIVKDGILNVDQLPVLLSDEDFNSVSHFPHEVIEQKRGSTFVVFKLRGVPLINRAMVERVELQNFVDQIALTEECKAKIKVLGHYIEETGGTTNKIAGMVNKYGEDAAKWLSEIGVRDYGFSPVGTKTAEATDEYESVQVSVKLKGASSLPSINAVQKKIDGKSKLNIVDNLINDSLVTYKGVANAELVKTKDQLVKVKRALEQATAEDVYSLVLGRKWFGDDEVATATVALGAEKTVASVEKIRKMISI